MDAHPVADLDVVLHDRMRADADIVADRIGLADHRAVAGLEPVADAARGIHDRVGADAGPSSDTEWRRVVGRRTRAEDHIILNDRVIAKLDARIHDRRPSDDDRHVPRSLASGAQSALC